MIIATEQTMIQNLHLIITEQYYRIKLNLGFLNVGLQ